MKLSSWAECTNVCSKRREGEMLLFTAGNRAASLLGAVGELGALLKQLQKFLGLLLLAVSDAAASQRRPARPLAGREPQRDLGLRLRPQTGFGVQGLGSGIRVLTPKP